MLFNKQKVLEIFYKKRSKVISKDRVKKYKNLYDDYKARNGLPKSSLSEEQKAEINELFEDNYGQQVPLDTHELYTLYSGKYDKNYFPEQLHHSQLDFYLNPYEEYGKALEDKNFVGIFTKAAGVLQPKTYWGNSGGIDFDADYNWLTKDQIVDALMAHSAVFIKPSVESYGGTGCKLIKYDNSKRESVETLVDEISSEYEADFVVQEVLSQAAILKEMYPYGVNTFRIVTYIMGGEVKHIPGYVRMGRDKKYVDNASSGGIYVGLEDDGTMHPEAHDNFYVDVLDKHPDTGFVFAGHKIEAYSQILEVAHRMHHMVPQLGKIDWDFTLNENNEPVLVEMNCIHGGGIELSQVAHGKGAFGENTPHVLRWIKQCDNMSYVERNNSRVRRNF